MEEPRFLGRDRERPRKELAAVPRPELLVLGGGEGGGQAAVTERVSVEPEGTRGRPASPWAALPREVGTEPATGETVGEG